MAMGINNAYNAYVSAYTNGTQSKAVTKAENSASSSAAKSGASDYLVELQKKNPSLNILIGHSNGVPGSSNYPETVNVTIAPEFLAKMQSDPDLAAEYEKNLADIPAACKYGESLIASMTGNKVYEFRFYIDENGNMSAGSISGPSEKREAFERSRQRAKQQKDDFNKRLEESRKASTERKEKTEKLAAEKRAEKKEQEEQRAEQMEEQKEEKATLQTHEIKVVGNDVWKIAAKMTEAISRTSASTTATLDITV